MTDKYTKIGYYELCDADILLSTTCGCVTVCTVCGFMHSFRCRRTKFCMMCNFMSAVSICLCIWVIIFIMHGTNTFKLDTTVIYVNKWNYFDNS
jgi:hypothetical protein